MRRLAWLVALWLAALPFVAAPQQGGAPIGVYIALGDSIPAGIGSSLPRERSYPALVLGYMESHLGGQVIIENLAEPGATAQSFLDGGQLARYQELVTEMTDSGMPVLAVTVTLGGNEVLDLIDATNPQRQVALDAFRVSLGQALAQIRAAAGPETPIAITTIYDPTGTPASIQFTDAWWIARFNDVIRELAQVNGVAVADVAEAFAQATGELTRFPVDPHPTNAGHRKIAQVTWGALGYDDTGPEIEVLSPLASVRLTPTLRFTTSEPVVPESMRLATDADLTLYPLIQLSDTEFVALLELNTLAPGTVTITISVTDNAGNQGEVEHSFIFAPES